MHEKGIRHSDALPLNMKICTELLCIKALFLPIIEINMRFRCNGLSKLARCYNECVVRKISHAFNHHANCFEAGQLFNGACHEDYSSM